METELLPPAVFLMGPTASGKSALAVRLAQAVSGEIISVDSALVYQGMDIGTAKPTLEERQGIAHHLIDILDPKYSFSTGRFRTLALEMMAEITGRGKIPILTGGTMLYFNALFRGLASLPKADAGIRAQLSLELERHGKEVQYRRLAKIDPDSAARIHPNDPQRIQRALEVFEISGKPLSSFFSNAERETIPYRKIKLIISPENRKTLHETIALRFHRMLEQGFVEEVERLFRRGDLNETMPAVRAVGYRQVWSFLKGDYDFDTMTEKGIVATRQLAKRQHTWLRKEKDALILSSGEDHLLEKVCHHVSKKKN